MHQCLLYLLGISLTASAEMMSCMGVYLCKYRTDDLLPHCPCVLIITHNKKYSNDQIILQMKSTITSYQWIQELFRPTSHIQTTPASTVLMPEANCVQLTVVAVAQAQHQWQGWPLPASNQSGEWCTDAC